MPPCPKIWVTVGFRCNCCESNWRSNCKLCRDALSSLQVVIFLIPKTWENSKNSKNYWAFCLFHSKPCGLADSESSSLTGATAALEEGFQGMRWILRPHPWAPFSPLNSNYISILVRSHILLTFQYEKNILLAGEFVCICTRMLSVRACARQLCAFVFFCRGQRASN